MVNGARVAIVSFSLMDERMRFIGRVSHEELWSTYIVADAVVCASKQEGFGLTILEGLCAGCKVISTDVGVVQEIRERMESVVPASSPMDLAAAMVKVLGATGKPRHVEVTVPYDLSWERCAHQTVLAYEKALEQRRNRSG